LADSDNGYQRKRLKCALCDLQQEVSKTLILQDVFILSFLQGGAFMFVGPRSVIEGG
jgi:hypothetical protein